MVDRIKMRRDTAANWATYNPVLGDGELGFERDTGRSKLGDGATAWTALAYQGAYDRARANHTGEQAISTITGLQGALDTKEASGVAAAALAAHEAAVDPHPLYATASEAAAAAPVQSVAGRAGAVVLSKADVGLSGVDNTSDADKPVSTATQAALDGKAATGHTHNESYAALGHTHDASAIVSGTIDPARLPASVVERIAVVADDSARFALTLATVQTGDVVRVQSSGLMYYVVDDAQLGADAGYAVFSAGTAASVPWSGVTGKPATFTPSAHTHTLADIADGGAMATQSASAVAITGGSINNTPIGATTQSTGAFTTLSATGKLNVLATVAEDTAANLVNLSGSGYGLRSVGGGAGSGHYIAQFSDSASGHVTTLDDTGLSVTGALSSTGRHSATSDQTTPTDGSAYFYKSSAGAVVSGSQVVLETGSTGSRSAKVTVDNSGNLGLGVTPSAWGNATKAIQVNNQSAFWSINSSNPNAWVSANTYFDNTNLRYINTATAMAYQQTNGEHIWYTAPSGTAGNAITFTQAMALTSSGDLYLAGNFLVGDKELRWDESGVRSWAIHAAGGALNLNCGDGLGTFAVGMDMAVSRSVTIGSFTTATRPAHAAGKMIYVSDASAGSKFQGSDGSSWVSLG